MKLYIVGGAVRDRLLGLPQADRDWVAVGATPQQLLDLGYKPVGRDFPVFLHPQTHEEVALARTERKTGPGYHGFAVHAAPGVTLEDDLRRRDLTINAIAEDEHGTLIDPFGGQVDLRARLLRHVSEAFVEDPVRLLRVARLAARFPDFTVAPETQALLRQMVQNGEVDTLVPERVWQEISRGLMAQQPSRMVQVLHGCGAWARLLPDQGLEPGATLQGRLDAAAGAQAPLPVRFALLCADMPNEAAVRALADRLRAPAECKELAELLLRCAPLLQATDAAGVMALLRCGDLLRRPQRLAPLLQAAALCGISATPRLQPLQQAALSVDTAVVAANTRAAGLGGEAIGQAIQAAQQAAIEHALTKPAAL